MGKFYEQYVDRDMVFDPEEVESFKPEGWVLSRMGKLSHSRSAFKCILQLGVMQNSDRSEMLVGKLVDGLGGRVNDYAHVLRLKIEMGGEDTFWDLENYFNAEDWLTQYRNSIPSVLAKFATLADAIDPNRETSGIVNKTANALNQEIRMADRLIRFRDNVSRARSNSGRLDRVNKDINFDPIVNPQPIEKEDDF